MSRTVEIDWERLEKLKKDFNQLTEREFEIVKLLNKCMTSKEIAEVLCISCHTVDSHRRKIIEKLDIVDPKCLQFLKID